MSHFPLSKTQELSLICFVSREVCPKFTVILIRQYYQILTVLQVELCPHGFFCEKSMIFFLNSLGSAAGLRSGSEGRQIIICCIRRIPHANWCRKGIIDFVKFLILALKQKNYLNTVPLWHTFSSSFYNSMSKEWYKLCLNISIRYISAYK